MSEVQKIRKKLKLLSDMQNTQRENIILMKEISFVDARLHYEEKRC
jgi:hypothetical protein